MIVKGLARSRRAAVNRQLAPARSLSHHDRQFHYCMRCCQLHGLVRLTKIRFVLRLPDRLDECFAIIDLTCIWFQIIQAKNRML